MIGGCFGAALIILGVVMLVGGLLFNLLVALLGGVLLIAGILLWRAVPEAAEKACPRCAERVKAAAHVCRFCGHRFAAQAAGEGW